MGPAAAVRQEVQKGFEGAEAPRRMVRRLEKDFGRGTDQKFSSTCSAW